MRNVLQISSFLLLSACASHVISSAEFEGVGAAGQPFRHAATSIGGRSGLSSDGAGYVTRNECRSGDLARVELRRNFGQTLLTLLSLGIVSPGTFYFYCAAPEGPPPPCDCEAGNSL